MENRNIKAHSKKLNIFITNKIYKNKFAPDLSAAYFQ